jgi:hypothetical protein
MAKLDVSGNFLITVGQGLLGPETWVVLSVSDQAGNPKFLNLLDLAEDPWRQPVQISLLLSAMFVPTHIPLSIVEIKGLHDPGWYGFRVEAPSDLGARLEQTRPSVLGILVDDGTDRGRAFACSCGGAQVTPWYGERTETPREG